MKWFSPFFWAAYAKEHFVAWNLSTAFTWVGSAFPFSLAYPNWARDLVHNIWPVVQDVSVATRDVVWEFLNTS